MANDELYTPKWIFDSLGVQFDLDVCAPIEGPLHTPAKAWFSELDDGLSKDWFGCVWMNPPYSKPSPWVNKWLEHKNGIALLPLSGNAKWWYELWNSKAMGITLKPRSDFITKEGKTHRIVFGTSLWALGEHNILALENSGIGKIR
jgi:hypothetical protein